MQSCGADGGRSHAVLPCAAAIFGSEQAGQGGRCVALQEENRDKGLASLQLPAPASENTVSHVH